MIKLFGKISDKMRQMFGNDVGNWPAYRMPEEIRDMPKEYYKGIKMGRRWEQNNWKEE